MPETIVLDPAAETTGRTEVDITDVIAVAGVDWGDASIEPYYAQADLGEIPVDYRTPNRQVSIPLILRDRGANSFHEWRTILQAKVGLWQREGGVISRETAIGTVYADVVNATLKLGGSWFQSARDVDEDAVLTLTCVPDWYEAEVELTPTTGGTGDVIRVLAPTRGDHPGRVRIVVDDTEGVSQHGVIWGFRSKHYSGASTAALTYQAEALGPLDLAAGTALSGASGGTAVRHGNLGVNWTPVLSTDIGGTAALTHEGSYRAWARCYSTSDPPPRVRFIWDVGDLTNPAGNTASTIANASSFQLLDLGEIRLDPPAVGTHRWRGMIQAIGEDGGENVAVDKIWFQPLDEYAGSLRTEVNSQAGLTAYSARDEFNQAAGTLTGKVLPLGGTWAGAGDASDFDVDSFGNHTVTRIAISDSSGLQNGRFALAGTATYTNVAVQADVGAAEWLPLGSGLVARYTDTNNFLVGYFDPNNGRFTLTKRVSGSDTVIGHSGTIVLAVGESATPVYTFRLLADSAGRCWVWFAPAGSTGPGELVIAAQDTALATGGGIASGRVGIWDSNTFPVVAARTFDNFAAWVPDVDAVVHSNQSLEIRTDSAVRENPAGTSYGPVSWITGDLPRLPAPGLESRSVELLVKVSRGDLGDLPDSSPDDSFNSRVFYRPSYLFVPAEP